MANQDDAVMMMLQGARENWTSFSWDTATWDSTSTQLKEAREASLATRKQLAETTKQFKKSVKAVETAGTNLNTERSDENSSTAVKAIDSIAKSCRVTVKAYQGTQSSVVRWLIIIFCKEMYTFLSIAIAISIAAGDRGNR